MARAGAEAGLPDWVFDVFGTVVAVGLALDGARRLRDSDHLSSRSRWGFFSPHAEILWGISWLFLLISRGVDGALSGVVDPIFFITSVSIFIGGVVIEWRTRRAIGR